MVKRVQELIGGVDLGLFETWLEEFKTSFQEFKASLSQIKGYFPRNRAECRWDEVVFNVDAK